MLTEKFDKISREIDDEALHNIERTFVALADSNDFDDAVIKYNQFGKISCINSIDYEAMGKKTVSEVAFQDDRESIKFFNVNYDERSIERSIEHSIARSIERLIHSFDRTFNRMFDLTFD